MGKKENVIPIESEQYEPGQIVNIKEDDDGGEIKKSKKGLSRKNKTILIVSIAAMISIGYLLLGMLFEDENKNSKLKDSILDGIKTKDLIAQEKTIADENLKKESDLKAIQDKTFDSAKNDNESIDMKGQDLMAYLNKSPEGAANDNFIANEETSSPQEKSTPGLNSETDSLRDKINNENISTPSRAITLKEDYALEKGTSFAYSKEYDKAENYDKKKEPETNEAAPGDTSKPIGETNENEFEGLSEAQTAAKIMEKSLAMAGIADKSKSNIQKPNISKIIYNKLDQVRIYEGQMLNGVLLNKLICDTEESPVLVSIARDLYDSKGLYVIIPAGSRVIGYSQVVNYQGASRLFISFHRMILPNGVSVDFPSANKALDTQGSMGIATSVNRHFWAKMGSAIFVGLLDGLGGLAQSKAENTQWSPAIERSQNNMSQISNQIVTRNTNIMPTITVKEGYKIKIYISTDIIISAYSLISKRSYSHD